MTQKKAIRIPDDLYALIKHEAEKQGITINAVAVLALRRGIHET